MPAAAAPPRAAPQRQRPLDPAPAPHVAIIQSNYVPWKGYIDIIAAVDVFVLFDDVQFTRRDWRNRNRIKTKDGPLWLTIPVVTKGRRDQAIDEVEIADPQWAEKHWRAIEHAYARAPYFRAYADRFAALYAEAAQLTRLSAVNRLFLEAICAELGIVTQLVDARPLAARGVKTQRLVDLCQRLGAGGYLSGPAARAYLDEDQFRAANIALKYMNYDGYDEHHQDNGPFDHKVSVIDLLFNTGPDAPRYFKHVEARPSAAPFHETSHHATQL